MSNKLETEDFYKKGYEDYGKAYRRAKSALEAIGELCPECRKKNIIHYLISTGKSEEL